METQFVQVLLSAFKLERLQAGVELSVKFDSEAATITRRTAKTALQQAMPNFDHEARKLQNRLDDFSSVAAKLLPNY